MIFKFYVAIVVFVAASAVKQDDESRMKILAKERKEMREERKEMLGIFQRKTKRLEKEDRKLQEKNDQLQRQNDEQKKEMEKQSLQLAQQSQQMAQQSQEMKQLKAKQSQEMKQLKAKLRQSLRQKSTFGNEMDEFDTKVKKIVKAEMNEFLISEKICVSGRVKGGKYLDKTTTVQFHNTFPRKPTVSASLAYIGNGGYDPSHTFASIEVVKVTTDSADIYLYKNPDMHAAVAWIACL